MQQKIYQGELSPEALADYLVTYFDPQHDIQAQKLGKDATFIVQIGAGDVIEKIHNAVSVTITKGETGSGLVVTMGEQRWFTPKMASSAAFWGIIALLITPWALFMLLWPLRDAIAGSVMPEEIWNQIDLGVASQGGSLTATQSLKHPHES
ncbi:hypothetical protein GO755_39855 [Spirosoma sp. HMF4905]|uniref:Uncharacterized protein n=1 Tax=Spirosoma arboris TaxID=2682092 RepID=A0A7K1SRA9_9BACT|nr:hypothetical protein [Spirosoma arboris]MVM36233.1 hypothetical protein [Spirosoma arboris]